MAKKQPSSSIAMFKEPTPADECAFAIDRAAEKAVLAHPKTQKLREAIKQRMVKAAGNGGAEASTARTSVSKPKKKK